MSGAPTWINNPTWPSDACPAAARLHAGVGLGLAILKATKTPRWSDLGGVLPEPMRLTDLQLDAIHAVEEVLGLLSPKSPTITVLICPVCARWSLHAGGPKPSTCVMTARCPGKPGAPAVPVTAPTAPPDPLVLP